MARKKSKSKGKKKKKIMMKHEMHCKMIKLEAGVEVIMTAKHNSSVVTLSSENRYVWLHVSRMKTLTALSIKREGGAERDHSLSKATS